MLACQQPQKTKREPIQTLPGGREIVCLETTQGKLEYRRRTYEMMARQDFKCAICGRIFGGQAEFDHQDGRGMNGSNRDDRIEVDGKWLNAALCHDCNSRKGSKRYAWIDELYLPIRFAPEAA